MSREIDKRRFDFTMKRMKVNGWRRGRGGGALMLRQADVPSYSLPWKSGSGCKAEARESEEAVEL